MSIDVGTLRLRCRVPDDLGPTAAGSFLERLHAAAPARVVRALSHAFEGLDGDPRVLFIDSLHVDLVARISDPPDGIGERLAQLLARAVWSAIDDPHTRVFRDGVELWARFFSDLASGRSFAEDWHQEFNGYALLPASATLRSLIELDSKRALEALSRLAARELTRVVAILDAADADRSVEATFSSATSPCRDVSLIAAALCRVTTGNLRDARDVLAFAAALKGDCGADADRTTVDLALQLGASALKGSHTPGMPQDEAIAECRNVPRAGASAARRSPDRQGGPPSVAHGMRYGGFWIVLEQALRFCDPPRCASLAFAYAALAFGPGCAELWHDRTLRSFLALPHDDEVLSAEVTERVAVHRDRHVRPPRWPPDDRRPIAVAKRDLAELRRAANVLPIPRVSSTSLAAGAYCLLRAYARRLPGFGAASNAYLRRNFLATPAIVQLRDEQLIVRVTAPPLQVIWRISGAGEAIYALPGGRVVAVEIVR